MTPTPDRAEIARHVSRLEGQLASVKAQLMSERRIAQSRHDAQAASRSFASFAPCVRRVLLVGKFPAAAKRPDAEVSSEYAAFSTSSTPDRYETHFCGVVP